MARQELRKILEEKNLSADTVDGFFSTHSETEIRQTLKDLKISEIDASQKETTEAEKIELLDEAIKQGHIKINENALYDEIEAEKEEVEDKAYNKLLKGGVSEDVALANAKLFGQFFKKYGAKSKEAFNKWFNKLEVKFNVTPEELQENLQKQSYQSQNTFDRENIENSFGDTVENITDGIKEDVKNILAENDISAEEFNFEDIKIYGSYSTGKNKENSDLDIIVQYSGSMREDDAFNMFHDTELTLTDKNGNNVVIDINPINTATSGTIADKLNQMNKTYYQINSGFFNEVKKVYIQLQDILSKKGSVTADEVFKKKPILEPLKSYFDDVLKTVKVKSMPEWLKDGKNDCGRYLDFNKTIYLNPEAFEQYPNKEQWFIRTFLHELLHAKQYLLLDYAKKNKNNKNLSFEERNELKKYINFFENSQTDTKKIKKFKNKYSSEDIKKSKKLAREYYLLYNKYENAYLETDADNVALALQYYIGNAHSKILQDYLGDIFDSENEGRTFSNIASISRIRAFNERRSGRYAGIFPRLHSLINTKIFYQSAYHGTAVRGIENTGFDLSYAFSGEGAMAHGYGVYTAKDKNVSETYRESMSLKLL